MRAVPVTNATNATKVAGGRRAITLIELLVVIAIIAILMSLLVPAVMRVRLAGDRAKVRAEVTGLQMASSNFSGTVGIQAGYPLVSITPSVKAVDVPDYTEGKFRLATSYLDPATGQPLTELVQYVDPLDNQKKTRVRAWPEIEFLLAVFPNMNLADNGLRVKTVVSDQELVYVGQYDEPNVPPVGKKVAPTATAPAGWLPVYKLDGNQALMFWLTGGTVTEFKGFSNNPARPLSPMKPMQDGREPEKRKGPFMEVNAQKFTNAKSGVMDGRLRDPWGTPYAVLGAIKANQDYHPQVVYSDFEDPTNKLTAYFTVTGYYNKGGVQIVSAGPDRRFGPGGKYTPGIDEWATGKAGGDDLANFKKDPLSSSAD